jgi:hypothetical protein
VATTAAVGLCVLRANLLTKESDMIPILPSLLVLPFRAEKISHVSTVFYFGLEGLGGLDLETDQDQDVRAPFVPLQH